MHDSENYPFPNNTVTEWERNHFYDWLLWLFPLTFLCHIYEESHGFFNWVTYKLGGHMAEKMFYINNACFVLLSLLLCWLCGRIRKPWPLFILFFWVGAQEWWDAIFHIYEEYHLNTYSPGYFTSIFLYLPCYCYLSYLLIRERFLNCYLWLLTFLISPLALLFTIWAGLYHFQSVPWTLLF